MREEKFWQDNMAEYGEFINHWDMYHSGEQDHKDGHDEDHRRGDDDECDWRQVSTVCENFGLTGAEGCYFEIKYCTDSDFLDC